MRSKRCAVQNQGITLNFSSAGKGPFLTGKAKNICQRCTFLREGGSGVRDKALPSLGKFLKLIKLSEKSFSYCKAFFRLICQQNLQLNL